MLKLFKRSTPKQLMEDIAPVTSDISDVRFDPDAALGEFNIILMVKDAAPKRLDAIKKEAAKLEKRLSELGKEAGQLEALVNALK